jgi:hypothetical protein
MRSSTLWFLAASAMGCGLNLEESAPSGLAAGDDDLVCEWVGQGVSIGVLAPDPAESDSWQGMALGATADTSRQWPTMQGYLHDAGDVDWLRARVTDAAFSWSALGAASFSPSAEITADDAYGAAVRLCGTYLLDGEPAPFACAAGSVGEVALGTANAAACCATSFGGEKVGIRLDAGRVGQDDSGELLLRIDHDPSYDASAMSRCGRFDLRYGAGPEVRW